MDSHEPGQEQAGVEGRSTIPEKKYLPKPAATPAHKKELKNFADNEETVKQALLWIRGYLEEFKGRAARKKFETDADVADEMYRAAKNRLQLNSDETENVNATASKIKSASFYTDIRMITAGQKAIVLGNEEELPMRYEPLSELEGVPEDVALSMSDDRNAWLSHVMEVAKLRKCIGKIFFYTNKYSLQVMEMGWDYRREEREVREPIAFEDRDGVQVPTRFGWKKKMRTVADNPVVNLHEWRNSWWDSSIFNIQDQSCLIFRKQMQYSDLLSLYRSGEVVNIDQITSAELYKGEGDSPGLSERQGNAGEDGDSEVSNGLYDVYRGYCRFPADPETGKWEPKKVVSEWWEYIFAGDITSGGKCLQLIPLRYKNKKIPVEIVYSHEDDKGSIKLGYATLVKSIIAQEMTIFDQYFDNNTNRNQVPLIIDRNAINIRDRTFTAGGNRVWIIKPGARYPDQLTIQDTTQQAIPMINLNDERRRRTMGTLKAFEGIAAGGRTSATESTLDFQQAVKPALEDTKLLAGQVLPFIAEWVWDLTEQFGDPEIKMRITYNGEAREVTPSQLYGPYTVRVTAVKHFEDNLIAQQRDNQFLSLMFPLYMQTKGARPEVPLKDIFKRRGYENVDTWWQETGDTDALRASRSENEAILWQGFTDFPKEGENHEVHLNGQHGHIPYLASVVLLPKEDQPPEEYILLMKQHIEQTKQMMQQATQPTPQPGAAQGAPPQLEGEAQGDMMGAEAGALENLPQQGAPTYIEGAQNE